MAVPEGLRGTGKLEVFEKALDLATYTITITANKKVFLPEYQGSLTDKINGVALAIYMECLDRKQHSREKCRRFCGEAALAGKGGKKLQ